ncbi:hypothetical protein J7L05_05025 [bacterium]|nr:hypothetical protein [bacterium]
MIKLTQFLFITFLVSLFMLGCSSGSNSPVSNLDTSLEIDNVDSLPLWVSDSYSDGSPYAGMGVLGLFEISIDSEKEKADITSLRSGTLTDVLEVIDITNFMTLFPCVDCVSLKGIGFDANNNVILTIGIKHPFPAGNPADPISGKNRADLHVFNVEGIVISDVPGTFFDTLDELIPGFRLLNADGYTGYLDESIDSFYLTLPTIHPYITHFDVYSQGNFDASNPMGFASVTSPPPSGNLVMPMGSGYDYEDYIFELSGTQMNFIFAVGCTYAVTTETYEDRFTPEYRVPQHNKKAASKVSVSIHDNNFAAEDTDSTAQIQIEILDINHGVAVGTNLDQMLADSSVELITVEIPDVMTDVFEIDGADSISGTGHNPSEPLLYQALLTNTAGAVEGTYMGLVKVLDSYQPGQNTHPFIGDNDGGRRVPPGTGPLEGLFAMDGFSTYQVFSVYVGESMQPPVAHLTPDPDPAVINLNGSVDLDATSSYDTDGSITLYEFDFDWDGVEGNFTVDESNITGLATTGSYATSGDYQIGLRVTDDDTFTGYTAVPLHVNFPPIADLVKVPDVASLPQAAILNLDATGSSDSDGIIVNFDFDFDWDGVPGNFTVDASNMSGFYDLRLLNAGTFTIGVRITDNNGAVDYDSVDIEVTARDVIFVDDDNTAGPWDGSFDNPYQYIQDGVDAVPGANYTVWIMPGMYLEDPGGAPTSSDATINIGFGRNNLTLFGEGYPIVALHEYTGVGNIPGLYNEDNDNLVIDGIMFSPSSSYDYAVKVNGINGITIRNCSIVPDTPGFKGFVSLNTCTNVLVENNNLFNVVFDFDGDSKIMHFVECDGGSVVTLNTIIGITQNVPTPIEGDNGVICWENSDNFTISKNVIGNCTFEANTGTNEFWGIDVCEGSNNGVIRNNLMFNITFDAQPGVGQQSVFGISASLSENCEIYNNTVDTLGNRQINNMAIGIALSDVTTIDIYNNIITNITSGAACYGIGNEQSTSPPDVDYCCVWSLRGDPVERYYNATEGANGLDVDPMYVPLMYDYHLIPGSPCEGTGLGGYDMGCYGGPDPLP